MQMVITQASYYSVNCSNFAPSSTTQISRPVEVSGGYDLAKGEEVLEADMKTKSNSKQHRKDKRNRRNGHHALSSTKGKVAVTCRDAEGANVKWRCLHCTRRLWDEH